MKYARLKILRPASLTVSVVIGLLLNAPRVNSAILDDGLTFSPAVLQMSISPDMRYLVYMTPDDRVSGMAINPARKLADYDLDLVRHTSFSPPIVSIHICPADNTFVALFKDGYFAKCSMSGQNPVWYRQAKQKGATAFCLLSLNGRLAALTYRANKLSLVGIPSMQTLWTFKKPLPHLTDASISSNGTLLTCVIADGELQLVDVKRQHVLASSKGTILESEGAAFSADSRRFICEDNKLSSILVWGNGRHPFEQKRIRLVMAKSALSPNGRTIAISTKSDRVDLFKLSPTGGLERRITSLGYTWPLDPKATTSTLFSPDSQFLFLGDWDGSIVMWNLVTMKRVTLVPQS
jgi:WD40 repeat protein